MEVFHCDWQSTLSLRGSQVKRITDEHFYFMVRITDAFHKRPYCLSRFSPIFAPCFFWSRILIVIDQHMPDQHTRSSQSSFFILCFRVNTPGSGRDSVIRAITTCKCAWQEEKVEKGDKTFFLMVNWCSLNIALVKKKQSSCIVWLNICSTCGLHASNYLYSKCMVHQWVNGITFIWHKYTFHMPGVQ